MRPQERSDLQELFEMYPRKKESFLFMLNFHFYWHDQNLFISKLKELDIDIESARSYYSKLKISIDQNPEFIRYWCKYTGTQYQWNQFSVSSGSLLSNEIQELQILIHSIIKN
jgi:hypothetical protein